MTRGPRRLLEDPDFKWETGCDLADEKLLVDNYDTDAMKKRLLAAIALGAGAAGSGGVTVGDGTPVVRAGFRWSAALKPVAGIVAAVGAVTLSFWAGMQARDADVDHVPPPAVEVPVAPSDLPSMAPSMDEAAPPEPAIPSEEPTEPPAGSHAARAPAPLAELPAVAPALEVALAPVLEAPVLDAASDDGVAEVALDALPEAVRTSDLPGQTADYDAADAALGAGRYREAKKRFGDYLVSWPDGGYASEAKLGLLEALHGLGEVSDVERYAAVLAEDPTMSHLRHEILRLRAESLVKLDRCGEALLVAEEVSARTLADIRRACRQIRREGP